MKQNLLFCFFLLGHLLVCASTDGLYLANVAFPDSIEYAKIPLWKGNAQILVPKMISDTDAYYIELNTPNVLDQGMQGSCAGFAFGYAAMGVLAYDKYGNWNAAKRSPAYLYHRTRIADGVNEFGSSAAVSMTTAYNVACQYGCCSYDMMPYVVSDYNSVPTELQDCDAYMNRAEGYRLKQTTNIQTYKEMLRSGYPIVVRIEITPTFDNMWRMGGIWNTQPMENSRGGHFICIVGYNDSIQMLKAQNSWGDTGGDNGFIWISYDLVQQGVFTHAICFTNITEGHCLLLQGPSQFCDTAVYTLENVPAGATIEWKYSPNTMRSSALRIVRGQGSASATFRRGFIMNGNIVKPPKPIGGTVMKAGDGISKPFSGAATVMATVTMNNGTSYTVSKAVTLPPLAATETPIVTGWNNSLWYVDISHTLYVGNCDSVPDDRIAWEVHLPGRSEPISHVGRSVTFKPTTSGTVTVIVANTESCSASNRDTLTHTVRFKPIISYANPVRTAGTVEVSVEEQTADFATVTVPYDGEYTLELWSELYGRVRTVESDAATVQIPLSGLNAGTYFLKLIINNEPITTQQLIIK